MKSYFFFNTTIANVGGAELYISNKCNHLKDLGYKVYVISYQGGPIVIQNLAEYEKYIIPELRIHFRRSTKELRRKILQHFTRLDLEGDVIIESNTVFLCPWGEFIAKNIKALHLCYLLPETNYVSKKDFLFYQFKLKQRLLYGITNHSVSDMLSDGNKYLYTFLPAVGGNSGVIDEDNSYSIKGWKKADFTILSLGRLNKPYILFMLDAVDRFSSNNRNNTINLILVGGYLNSKTEHRINDLQNSNSNVNIYMIGEISPIPSNIFKISDVSISVAGCANVCRRQGLLNIAVDANDFEAIGITGVTTENSIFRKNEPPIAIEQLLSEILINGKYNSVDLKKENKTNFIDYSLHDKLLLSPSNLKYYAVSPYPDSLLSLLIKIVIKVFGCVFYLKMFKLLNRRNSCN